jgi:hypothetical protein
MGEPTCQRAGVAFAGHGGDVGRWDGFVHKARRKVAVVRHPRPSRELVAGDLESQALRRHHCRGRAHGRGGRRDDVAKGAIG